MIFLLERIICIIKVRKQSKFGKVFILSSLILLFRVDAIGSNPKIFRICKQLKIQGTELIASDNNTIIINSKKIIYAINLDNFTKSWEYETAGSLLSKPILKQNILILETYQQDKKINKNSSKITQTKLNINTGIPVEVVQTNKENNDPNFSTENLLSKIERISPNIELLDEIPVITVDHKKKLILGYKNGTILLLKKETGLPIWKTRVGGEVTNAAILENGILISSKDNFLYLLDDKTANNIWKKRSSGRILNFFFAENNNVAILTNDSEEIPIIDVITGFESGKIIKNFTGRLLDIKSFSPNKLLVLTESDLLLYSADKCE